MKHNLIKFQLIILLFIFFSSARGQVTAVLKDNKLSLSNSYIERTFLWNNGELISEGLTDKRTGEELLAASKQPAFYLGKELTLKNSSFKQRKIEANNIHESYLEAEILLEYDGVKLKRVFKISDSIPAIACDNYILPEGTKTIDELQLVFKKPIEMERLTVVAKYPKLKALEFFDRTDVHNNLVKSEEVLPYRKPLAMKGNILQISSLDQSHKGVFVLKEAPCSFVQLSYPGYDFMVDGNLISMAGIGLPAEELATGEWIKLYGSVVGCYNGTEAGFMHSLKSYQKSLRKVIPKRDEMIMMNTWGDRNRDASINEEFLKAELDACEKLGISHFQIDDGWQQGLSTNSAKKGALRWDSWDEADWKPHQQRLPNGLLPIVKYAKSKGVQMGLWFHPSNHNSYETWETDADIILDLYNSTGIRYFKIDGINLPDKLSDSRLRMLFEKVSLESNGEVVINLDATASSRTGYFYLNTFGNIFLENRYTDFANYYPHWTLRNLWQLSPYVPTRNLQIEFLNKWRNADVYGGDNPLSPINVPFEYTFAITMMAQPLAWFEGTGLPEEALELAPVIKKYKEIQGHIHRGDIFPIGNEPSGYGWTGFQSIIDDHSGYLLVFREKHKDDEQWVTTWLPANTSCHLTTVLGEGEGDSKIVHTNEKQEVRFSLQKEFSYSLIRYRIVD